MMEPKPLSKEAVDVFFYKEHKQLVKAACEWYLVHLKDYDQELELGTGELYEEWLEFIDGEYMDFPEWLLRKAFEEVLK